LARAGYEVVLIAPHLRGGHVSEEVVQGVRVRAIPRYKSRLARMIGSVWRVYREWLQENAEVYHLHDPELVPIGFLLKLRGKTVLYDVHEDLPLTISGKPWVPPRCKGVGRVLAWLLERSAATFLDGIVAATPGIARNFPPRKTVLVQNFPAQDMAAATSLPYRQRDCVVLYIGLISENRGIRELLDAMRLLPPSMNARLMIGGNFELPEFELKLKQHPGWPLAEYHPWQGREGVLQLLAKARVGAVVLQPSENFLESQPLKLFEYMAAGLPVIASHFPLWRQLIGESGCGILVDPQNTSQIADAIRKLLEDPAAAEEMGRRGREAVLTKYNWNIEAGKLLQLYRRTVSERIPSNYAGVESRKESVK
jgi:glycosyltransferase involved in cell wall biosynthesis